MIDTWLDIVYVGNDRLFLTGLCEGEEIAIELDNLTVALVKGIFEGFEDIKQKFLREVYENISKV